MWTLLLKHCLNGDSESRSRFRILAIIKVNSADTTFKTLSLPDAASENPMRMKILPLLFEAVLHITIRPETVTFRAPGTILSKLPVGGGRSDYLMFIVKPSN
jgi:hypothetical protein